MNYERTGAAYAKLVVNKVDDKILGFHFLGPNAG